MIRKSTVPGPGEGKRGPEGHLGYLVRQAHAAVRGAMEKALADLDRRHADAAGRRMDQQRMTGPHVERLGPGQGAGRGRIGDGELDRLDEAHVARLGEDVDLMGHDFLGKSAPVEHGHDRVADLDARAGRIDLRDDPRRLGTGREGEGRAALVLARDDQGRGEADARRAHIDTDLAGLQGG